MSLGDVNVLPLNIKKNFPKNLVAARSQLGWTQSKLARYAGLSQDWVSHFEGGRRLPSMMILGKLVESLGTSADFLMFNDQNNKPNKRK